VWGVSLCLGGLLFGLLWHLFTPRRGFLFRRFRRRCFLEILVFPERFQHVNRSASERYLHFLVIRPAA
jgi:hypothetical protein